MEMWLTIAAVAAVAGMGWDLALRFGPGPVTADDAHQVATSPLVSLEEPSA